MTDYIHNKGVLSYTTGFQERDLHVRYLEECVFVRQWQFFVKCMVLPVGILRLLSIAVYCTVLQKFVWSSRLLWRVDAFGSLFKGFIAVLCLIVCSLRMELWSPIGCVLNQSFKHWVGLYSKPVVMFPHFVSLYVQNFSNVSSILPFFAV